MFYAPHTLYVKKAIVEHDRYGRPIVLDDNWEYVCKCRCDENGTQELVSEEGKVYRSTYHIVCPRDIDVKSNEEIRVMNGDKVRGGGRARNPKHLNFLDYSEIWV